MTKVLYTASQISSMLDISRQAFNKAVNKGRIEENEYYTADTNIKCWTPEQVERIKRTFVKERE